MDIYTDQSGEYSYQVNDIKSDFVTDSTTVQEISGVSIRSNTEVSVNNYIIEADASKDSSIKVVTWAIENSSKTGFSRAKLLDIAKDYEDNHPGYVVLGGINADQYVTKFGASISASGADYYYPQSYYPMISSGDNYFAVTGLGVSSNVVGFKNDSSSTPLVNGQRSIKGLYLYIYDDESQVIGIYKVDSLNNMETLGDNQTTLLAPIKTENNELSTVNKNSTNSIYVVSDADLSYVSNSVTYTQKIGQNADAFFGKGEIGSIDNNISITNNQFAIETTNTELKSQLCVGAYVKAQYEFDDEFQGIEEAIGYHTKQIANGVDQDIDNSYNTRAYPRSLFGSDDFGNIYLWTTGGSNVSPTQGMYAQECNALASKYGITNLYQMDGGGSVSAVYRDSTGGLSYISDPIEGDYRTNLSGLFIVQNEVEVDCVLENVDDQTATFKVRGLDDTIYTGASIELTDNINSVIYNVKDNECIITNLNSSTTYTYRLYLLKD
ncbi:MAG: phosphodiester glycosidase family protein, partial [Bacilli bacterium]